jgi:ABC-2 type transport system permease protein
MTTPTNSTITGDRRLAARQGLVSRTSSGSLAGFGNLLNKELGEWFRTRRWLWQSIIWLVLINGFIAFILYVLPTVDPAEMQGAENQPLNIMALSMFFSFAIVAGSIGMIILVQDEIIQEKQSGTAAWILSKPVARPAFILSKWLSNIIGGLIFIVALPGAVTAAEIALAGQPATPLLPFLAGTAVAALTLIFYISLVIMLGVLFEQRGPVLGAAFGVMFGGMIIATIFPQINYVLPLSMDQIALSLSQGQALPAMAASQMVMTAVWSVIFLVVALRRFQRTEL